MSLLCLAACTQDATVNAYLKSTVTVSIIDDRNVFPDRRTVTAKRGDDIEFLLSFGKDCHFSSCSYPDYTVIARGADQYRLTLKNVKYSCRVSVRYSSTDAEIIYNVNGGEWTGGSDRPYLKHYTLNDHLRPNTLGGKDVSRDGYVLVGWNTERDGSGEHIGLGSRVTVGEDKKILLFAEWKKYDDSSLFDFEERDGAVTLTKYKGESNGIVVPAYIDGSRVRTIASGFANEIDIDSLVLPDGISTIDEQAFVNCDIKHLYLCDDIEKVSDESFSHSAIHYLHINAVEAPCYIGISDNAEFADKIDRLMLNADKKKLIFFGGCSMSYGLNSELVNEVYGRDYFIMNMGVVGGTNAQFQFNCMTPYIGEGDIFIHAPEVGSSYQLMYDTKCELRLFTAIECNFDLLSYTDLTEMNGNVFDSFTEFNDNRELMDKYDYDDYRDTYNDYGDIIIDRPSTGKDEKLSENYRIRNDFLSRDSLSVLCDKYDLIRDAGAQVYVSYSPTNKKALTLSYTFAKGWEDFENDFRGILAERGYNVISRIEDYIMSGVYFYDADYHLNDEGAELRTRRLLADMISAGIGGS